MDREAFEAYARAALAQMGVEVDDVDIAVMTVAESVYGPHRDALMAADLSGVPREHDLDPSRPPTGWGPPR